MQPDYFGFVAASYGAAAVAIGALIGFTWLDARRARARLRALEEKASPRSSGVAGTQSELR